MVCGGLRWFVVVCGGLWWFVVDCGGLSFSHTPPDGEGPARARLRVPSPTAKKTQR